MKATQLTLALTLCALPLGAGRALAQPEGNPCIAEPTDQLVAYGDHVNPCQIGQAGDSDLFRFHGVAGEIISIRVTDQAGGGSFPSCRLDLLRPAGTLLMSISDSTTCEIRRALNESGLFTARVSEEGNDELMTFTVEIDRLSPFSNVAASINPGDTIIGKRIAPRGDADLFVFNGVNGDVVSLRATDQAGGGSFPSVRLELFRPDGTMTSDDDSTIAIIDTTLGETGVFTLRVSEVGNDELMTYNVEYQCLVGSCPSFHKLSVGYNGAGAVTSTPVGITCGTDCAERYFSGTVVTLTPLPAPAWAFNSWAGPADCADGVVTMTTAVTCHATFVPLTGDDVVTDFGPPYGLWMLSANTTWQQLHSISPKALARGDFDGNSTDDLVVDFGDGIGVYAWMNHTSWQLIHSSSPARMVVGNLNNDASDEIVFNFTSAGLWIWRHGLGWTALHGLDANLLAAGNLDGTAGDELIVDFPGHGLYVYTNSASWSLLTAAHPSKIVVADLDGSGQDDLVIDFPALGLWRFLNNTTWLPLHALSASHLAAGRLDTGGQADLVVDLTPYGLWTFRNNTTWVLLHSLPVEAIEIADRDGGGRDDVLLDFGPAYGLWQYANDSAWSQLHTLSPKTLVRGRFH